MAPTKCFKWYERAYITVNYFERITDPKQIRKQIDFQQPQDNIQLQTPAQESVDWNVKSKSAGKVQEETYISKRGPPNIRGVWVWGEKRMEGEKKTMLKKKRATNKSTVTRAQCYQIYARN